MTKEEVIFACKKIKEELGKLIDEQGKFTVALVIKFSNDKVDFLSALLRELKLSSNEEYYVLNGSNLGNYLQRYNENLEEQQILPMIILVTEDQYTEEFKQKLDELKKDYHYYVFEKTESDILFCQIFLPPPSDIDDIEIIVEEVDVE